MKAQKVSAFFNGWFENYFFRARSASGRRRISRVSGSYLSRDYRPEKSEDLNEIFRSGRERRKRQKLHCTELSCLDPLGFDERHSVILRECILDNLHEGICFDTSFRSALLVFEEIASGTNADCVNMSSLENYVREARSSYECLLNSEHPRSYGAWQRFSTSQFLLTNFYLIAGQTGELHVIQRHDLELLEQRAIFRSSQEPSWFGIPLTAPLETQITEEACLSAEDLLGVQRLLENKLRDQNISDIDLLQLVIEQSVRAFSASVYKCEFDTRPDEDGYTISILVRKDSETRERIGRFDILLKERLPFVSTSMTETLTCAGPVV